MLGQAVVLFFSAILKVSFMPIISYQAVFVQEKP